MKRKALALSLILGLLFSVVGVQFASLAQANPYSFFWEFIDPIPGTIPAKITILSPKNNTTYSGGDLNITIHVAEPKTPYPTVLGRMWIRYFLDGNQVDGQYFIHPASEVDNGTILHDTNDGKHKLVVEAECFVETGNMTVFSIRSSSTVFFSVVDVTAPVISDLSIENKTYSQNDLSLYCEVDESTSWKGYSLDGLVNVTFVAGNYFSNLASGSHTLTVYANDTSGNMGCSETIYFTIEEPFPAILAIVTSILVVVVLAVGIGLLVYLIKRK